jgi:hypothetical protein
VRRAENQKLFREVNERIVELSATLDAPDGREAFFCECGRVGCREMLEIPIRLYAITREDDDLYFVLPGHEDLEHEQTITEHDTFVIVRTLRIEPGRPASGVVGRW